METDSSPDAGTGSPDGQSLAAPLIERSPVPMVEVEGALHLVCFVNPAFCRLLRKTREELLGRPFGQIVRNGEKCAALLDRVYETGEFETHVDADHSEANPSYWLYAMWPTLGPTARPERVVIQVTKSAHLRVDIAAMNEALLISGLHEHELRVEAELSNARSLDAIAHQRITEGELREANDHLRQATLSVERSSRAKDDFLAALSHELRTPLTPVLIMAASLREDPRLPPDVREQLGAIERNVTLEARLIDDLLDLTKISYGKLHLRSEPCDAHALIRLSVEIVRDDARRKEITIECAFQAKHSGLTADPARLQQVIWNLLRNAVKFTPPGGKISIRTMEQDRGEAGRWLRLEVTDTGIGIDPHHLEGIFLPFDQGDLGGHHRFGGVGLGLAIARSVVVSHGGRMAAESPGPGRGATFVVELPGAGEAGGGGAEPAPPRAGNDLPPRAAPAPLRLLLVEDHEPSLEVLSHALRRDGHRVVACRDLRQAVAAAAAQPFDLVISDLGLPDGTGNELMKTLRDAYGLRGVALTGYGMEDDVARSSAAGFVAHLVKPVSMADLRQALAQLGSGRPEPIASTSDGPPR